MKKIVLITLVLAALVLGLASCNDGSASGGGEFKFAGHYDVYGWNKSLKEDGDTSKDALLRNWLNGGWSKAKNYNAVYFDGDKWYLLDSVCL